MVDRTTMTGSRLDWRNIILLATVHVAAIGGLVLYAALSGVTLAATIIGVALTAATIFSISAGYHRLFAHRSYRAHPVLRFFLLAVGAGAFQNSALAWATDHRRHHAKTDTPEDPYSATGGFWHAHIGWVLRKPDPRLQAPPVPDLERDPLVRWQERHYALIGVVSGVLLPVGLGFLVGDPWGGFVLGAAVRLFVVYHVTFSINSIAHMLGTQPYSDDNSARDSLLTAFLSMGEGYHNYHHAFPADYRNGVRAYQFDPTKWILAVLATVGLVTNLRRVPTWAILQARLRMDSRQIQRVPLWSEDRLTRLRQVVEHSLERCRAIHERYLAVKRQGIERRDAIFKALLAQERTLRREVMSQYADWRRALRCSMVIVR